MSKFKVGDKVRIIEVCDIDEGIFEVGEVVTIIGDAESVSDGILYDIGEYNWCVYEHQIEKVEEVAFKVASQAKPYDPIESRIEEMQGRLDQLSEEIDRLMREEERLSKHMDVLRQAQGIMKEI